MSDIVNEEQLKGLIADLSENITQLAQNIGETDSLVELLGDKAEKTYVYLDMINSQIITANKAMKTGMGRFVFSKLKSFIR